MNDWQRSKTGLGRMGDDKVGDDYSNEGSSMLYDMDGELDLMERQQRRGRGRRRRPSGPVGPMPPPPPPIMLDENEEEDMMFDQDGGNYWINPTNTLDRYPDDTMRMMNENEGMMLAPGRRRSGRRSRLRRRNGRRDNMMMDEYDDDIDFFDDDDDDEMMEYRGEYGIPPPTRSR